MCERISVAAEGKHIYQWLIRPGNNIPGCGSKAYQQYVCGKTFIPSNTCAGNLNSLGNTYHCNTGIVSMQVINKFWIQCWKKHVA